MNALSSPPVSRSTHGRSARALARLAAVALLPFAGAQAAVSFRSEIAPILLDHCQTCHGPTEQRGGYRLDTFEFLGRNEDPSDPVLTAGNPDKSSLFHRLVTEDADERMPKKAPALPEALALKIKQWIAEGAPFDGEDRAAPMVELVPPKTHPPAPETYAAPVPVTALAFSPDGSELLVGGLREICVHDPATGQIRRRIGNVPARTMDIALHPDGRSFVTAGGTPGESGEIRQYDLASGKFLRRLASAADAFLDTEFTPDGKSLLVAGSDHSLSLVEVATGKKTHRLAAHSDAVTGLAMRPDGKQFASVGLDRIVKIFDTETAKLKSTYRDHQSGLYAVGFLPNDEVFSAGKDKSAHVWSQSDTKKKRELSGQGDLLRAVVVEGSVFAGGASGKVLRVPVEKMSVTRTYEGLSDWIYAIAYDPASKRVAAGSYDGTVAVWDAESGALLAQFPGVPAAQKP